MRTDKPTTTESAPETRNVDAYGMTSDECFSTSHQGKVHAANLKRRAKREAAKTKHRAEMETGRVPLVDGARQPNWTQIQRDAGNAPETRARLAVAQAVQLAEALRDALKYADSATEHPENKAAFKRIITQALAAYEDAQ